MEVVYLKGNLKMGSAVSSGSKIKEWLHNFKRPFTLLSKDYEKKQRGLHSNEHPE
jgi:hypothetical protein